MTPATGRAGSLPYLAATGAALLAAALPALLAAQTYETGGVQLTFGTAVSVIGTDNKGPRPVDGVPGTDLLITPTFGLLTQTPTSSFGFDAGTDIRYSADDSDAGIIAPRLSTAYTRETADAALALAADLRQTDLSQEDIVFTDATGGIGFVNGTATRRTVVADASLAWGQTARIGYGLSARVEDTRYSGDVVTALNGDRLADNGRVTLGAATTLDLTDVTRLTGDLGYSSFSTETVPGTSETLLASVGVGIDRPLGAVTTTLDLTDTDAGQRYGLSVGRDFDLALGPVAAQIGATRLTDGAAVLTAAFSAERETARGAFVLDAARDVSSLNEQNLPRVTTRMTLSYTRDLADRADLTFGFDLEQARDIASDDRSFDARVGAVYSRPLTPAWRADIGYRHRYVEDMPGQSARSNTAFVSLRRKVVTRY